uniref:Uncharacterized protein n=1 Tax=Cacopsylla melanoneura TaxID=428564 RepID=A0A8D8SZI6_9HEMI
MEAGTVKMEVMKLTVMGIIYPFLRVTEMSFNVWTNHSVCGGLKCVIIKYSAVMVVMSCVPIAHVKVMSSRSCVIITHVAGTSFIVKVVAVYPAYSCVMVNHIAMTVVTRVIIVTNTLQEQVLQ